MAVTSPTETGNAEGESGLGRKMANSRVEFEVSLEHRCLAVALTAPGEVGCWGREVGQGSWSHTVRVQILDGLPISKGG